MAPLPWRRQYENDRTASEPSRDSARETQKGLVALDAQSLSVTMKSRGSRRRLRRPDGRRNRRDAHHNTESATGSIDTYDHRAASAFDAHLRLTAIHPFGDGNARTARLLMNLMLIRGGYPPIAVRPADRKVYLDALERGSLAEDLRAFHTFMHGRLDATLAEYLGVLQEALPLADVKRDSNPGEPIANG